ncbi:four-helix bundle copper-binding protein [Roseateles chitosanitabidus]|nr:four-helix bundle copper-binding protein [Roseateles chitosanitabidus]MBO9687867.1 four-helix bundle copper-binding protein [Roseateles chitosanitabidus]
MSDPDDLAPCLKACAEALLATRQCANACIRSGDRTLEACALLDLDCAALCEATISALSLQSPHHGDFCALCAHLCRACAQECAKHPHAHCRRCAEACLACAKACDQHAGERHPLGTAVE